MKRLAPILTGPMLLAGCSFAPEYQRPELPVPASWPAGDAYPRQDEAAQPQYSYRDVFGDPRLKAIVALALANNQDVRLAVANIAAARANYRIQRAELLPELGGSAGYLRLDGEGDLGSSTGKAVNSYSAEGSLSAYELDLFGRIRSLSSAEQNRYFATEAAARATRLTLVADVADAWLTYAMDASLLTIARDTADAARKNMELTRRRLQGGIAPRSDLRQAEIALRIAEEDIAAQTTALAQALNALELLVGAPVDPAYLATAIEEAGAKFAEVPAGLDSAILLRRPDVIEAEYQLRAANAEIGAARAALFPKISLTGLLGFTSTALSSLFTNGNFGWEAGTDASYAIFRGGAGRAEIALSKAQRDAALATYRKAIQAAFRDVANALARRGTIEDQLKGAQGRRDAAADNYFLADRRYRGGVDSYLESLTAQQALYTAEKALVETRLVRASNLISLYRALGGDALEATETARR